MAAGAFGGPTWQPGLGGGEVDGAAPTVARVRSRAERRPGPAPGRPPPLGPMHLRRPIQRCKARCSWQRRSGRRRWASATGVSAPAAVGSAWLGVSRRRRQGRGWCASRSGTRSLKRGVAGGGGGEVVGGKVAWPCPHAQGVELPAAMRHLGPFTQEHCGRPGSSPVCTATRWAHATRAKQLGGYVREGSEKGRKVESIGFT